MDKQRSSSSWKTQPPNTPLPSASERTGLSQDLLRVWERRYQAVEPTRGPGGHRTYSDADIARLRLLHAVTAAGRSIGQVARLSTSELTRMAAGRRRRTRRAWDSERCTGSRDAGSHAAAHHCGASRSPRPRDSMLRTSSTACDARSLSWGSRHSLKTSRHRSCGASATNGTRGA